MKVTIRRDQAVWERETFEVEILDELYAKVKQAGTHDALDADDDLSDALRDAINAFDGYTDDDRYSKEILDSVPSLDIQIVAEFDDGTEIDL